MNSPNAACVSCDSLVEMVAILVGAGATNATAARAAVAINQGATIRDAYDLIELAAEPGQLDAPRVDAELARAREPVLLKAPTR